MRLGRAGTEPLQARSAYGLRRVLAWFGLVCGVLGGVLFAALALGVGGFRPGPDRPVLVLWAVLFAALVPLAVIDLVVLRRRTRRHPPEGS